jgi:hypothetical protein
MSRLALMTIMAGVMLVVMGLTGLGTAVKFYSTASRCWFHQRHCAAYCFDTGEGLPGVDDGGQSD